MLVVLWLYALLSLSWGAEVRIVSADQSLAILLDGVRLGNTPLVIDIAPGKHVLGARQVSVTTKAVRSTSSDDDILRSIFAEAKREERIETDIYVTDRGRALVTFSWVTRSADVNWSGEEEVVAPVANMGAREARESADAYRKEQRFSEAIAAYYQAIKLGESEEELMRWILLCERDLRLQAVTTAKERGDSLCMRGDIQAAVGAYEEAIEAGGNLAELRGLINECRENQNQINVVDAARERAEAFVNRGQIKEAIEAYEEAIRLGGPAAELLAAIRELEMWQANLVVKVTGLDKRGELVAYLEAGEGRIEPTSINRGVLRFEGIAAETDYWLFVGGEGYQSVQEEVEALEGRSTRELSVRLKYRGAMELELSDWTAAASVRLEQPPVSMELEPKVYSITAAPAEIVISAKYGTVRWPLDGAPGLAHYLEIATMLPSAVTIEGVPHGSAVEIMASPGNSANGPVFLSSSPKLRRDGAAEVIVGLEIADLRGGAYVLAVDHPTLGRKSSRFELEPGTSRTLNFDWRGLPEGERVEAAYSAWRDQRKGPPKEFWLGSGAGVLSLGAFGLMVSNAATARENHSQFLGYKETYLDEIDNHETDKAMATYDNLENVRNKRNKGEAYAVLEGVLGIGTAVLSARLFKAAIPKLGKSKAWSITDYSRDGAASEAGEAELEDMK
jgi:tetratricopeptide (TPR) repeat protein